MAQFAYKAVNKGGKAVKGVIAATNEADARSRLKFMGLNVKTIANNEKSSAGGGSDWKIIRYKDGKVDIALTPPTVKVNEIAVFTKQLSTLIDAGVGLVQSMDMLAAQSTNNKLKDVLLSVRTSIEGGSDLAAAMAKHPDVFDKLYCALVAAGSASGQLDVLLRRLAIYVEKANKLKKQLIGALTYPAIVVFIATAMTFGMLFFVVPMFAKNYAESGRELPGLTLMVIHAADWVQANVIFLFMGIAAAMFLFKKYRETPQGRMVTDSAFIRMPVFGSVIVKVSIARFAGTMSTLIASGIAIIEALDICAKAAGNAVIENEILKIKDDVQKGRGLGVPMAESKFIPLMVSGMVSVGEASGSLDVMLQKVSEFYEEEVDAAISGALKLIEPIMFVVIGGIVAFILLAMYLPIFDMAAGQ